MINNHAAVQAAYDSGRFHSQRFLKNAGSSGDTHWWDWAFASGQPAYDARIGAVASFTPVVAVKNDAIWFPDIPAGMERKLHKLMVRPQANNASQASIDFVMYDLVGYYPLIDGDSTDPQPLDNTLSLPRYTDGEGLRLVMVCHVAPAVQTGLMLLEYTDQAGASKSVTIGVPNLGGTGKATSGVNNSLTTISGPLTLSLAAGTTGVRSVDSITYLTPPGGLHCIYVIKPLAQFQHYHDALLQADTTGVKHAIEIDFALKDGWRMPTIQDGAHLGFFYRPNGGGRSVALFGEATFVWG